ncbi:protein YIF1A isoform X2 [Nematostella vectensis]|uniref:protein YIF1A isoform X2 n=1 Tax=Nematostella vectensis TaxID=45351 RepID=UPI001390420A|nr:protein YIF1A isoform X2 [Nematostella vectensis]
MDPPMYAHQRHSGYSAGSSPLFDDTSAEQHSSHPQGQGGMPFPGADFMQQPMTNMAFQYGTNVASQGKEYVEKNLDRFVSISKLKYYFAVDTSYVVKKLGLLLFPFTHKNWAVQYNKEEPVAPRYEVNAPDLYIPVMAFVTYVLVAGLVLGTQNRFTPEQLGITASSALIWLFVEIMAILFSMYLCNVQSEIKTFDLLAFCGYKYFGMILSCLAGLLFKSLGYYCVFIYTSITNAFFLIRTLRLVIIPETSDGIARTSKRRIYLLLFIAVLQPFFMFFLTSHLKPSDLAVDSLKTNSFHRGGV